MKKTTYVILLLFCVHFGFSQTEDDYQKTLTSIAEGYNSKEPQKIFDLFSAELQSTFTLDKVNEFINDNQANKGEMGTSTYLLDEDNCKRYLTEFENSSMVLIICLSADNKITKLLLEEY